MPFQLETPKASVKVVVSKDSAVTCSSEDYDKYLETLDETLLNLSGAPTRFVLRKTLPYDAQQKVMNAQASYEKGKVKINMAYVMEEVRLALVDIEHEEDVPNINQLKYKKDSDGYCSKDLVAGLQGAGVLMDLYRARQNASGSPKADDLAKKS